MAHLKPKNISRSKGRSGRHAKKLYEKFRKECPITTVHKKVLEYLCITINHRQHCKMKFAIYK